MSVKRSFFSLLFTDVSGNWLEIAYGTSTGMVRVIVQHPETVGSGPHLFQTFTVHTSPVIKVVLAEEHLISGKNTFWKKNRHFQLFCKVISSPVNSSFSVSWLPAEIEIRAIIFQSST